VPRRPDSRPARRRGGRWASLLIGGIGATLLLAAPARAACASTAECLGRIEAAQRDLHTLRARFVQTKRLSLLDEPLESSGWFLFKRPDRVRWETEAPERLTVVISGREVHIPNLPESERQALAMSPLTTMLSRLGALFTGEVRALEQGFEITATDRGSAIQVELVPREEAWRQSFRRIDLAFAAPEMTIAGIRLENALGDSVEIRFEEVVRNVDVPDSMFETGPG
jgi:outer membrane lipoprotein-sorting protein